MTSALRWMPLLVCVGGLLLGSIQHSFVDERYRKGVAAYNRGAYDQARTLLLTVFREEPGYFGHEGAVAFWLGKVYEQHEKPDSMSSVWKRGVEALRQKKKIDVRLFDAYLHVLLERRGRFSEERVADLYLAILRHVGADFQQWQLPILRRHVAQLRPLMADQSIREHLVSENFGTPSEWDFRGGGGDWLLSWWRRQDPVPSTLKNERLLLHLRRVVHAEERFKSDHKITGWDARGDVYVRYGRPPRRDRIPFRDMGLLTEVVRSGVSVSYADFPGNEIWGYTNLSEAGYYLFFKDQHDGDYKLGTLMDLLPSPLRGPFGPANRQQNVAYSSMAALRYLYNRLPGFYHDRGNIASQLNGWFSYQESRRGLNSTSGGREIGFGSGARVVFGGNGPTRGYPSSAATANIGEIRHQERQLGQRRTKEMPRDYFSPSTPRIDPEIRYRTARFLDEGGTTRTEVYWGNRLASDLEKERFLKVAAFRYDGQYRRVDKQTRTYVTGQPEERGRENEERRILSLRGAQAPYHIALQWDLYSSADSSQGGVQGRQVRRIDSLQTLSADPSRLEMSDLRPMVLTGPPSEITGGLPDAGRPYPFRDLSASESLLLGFEVYHLTYGEEDRTRFTVEYELLRQTERDGFFSFLRGDDESRTATASTYTGTDRRTSEYILFEWKDNPPKKPQPVTVTVRITDEITGQTVERSIHFRLLPPGSNIVGRAKTKGTPE